MTLLLTVMHVLVCVFLILVVLLQTGKGADLAAAFGGSSQTAFGARGAATLLTKLTTAAAIIFMLTSIFLAVFSTSTESVLEDASTAPASAPAGPGGTVIPSGTPPDAAAPPASEGGGGEETGGTAETPGS
jgi:preprotein translocase subunit SecG